jgi:hypothetical protein
MPAPEPLNYVLQYVSYTFLHEAVSGRFFWLWNCGDALFRCVGGPISQASHGQSNEFVVSVCLTRHLSLTRCSCNYFTTQIN